MKSALAKQIKASGGRVKYVLEHGLVDGYLKVSEEGEAVLNN